MKYPFFKNNFFRVLLIIATIFAALSAVGGGIGLIATNGLGMPTEWLIGSPFDSYFWPGIILLLIVGGTNALAAITAFAKNKFSPEYALVAGFGLQIWIFTEIYIVQEISWLQTVYFSLGIAILILGFLNLRSKE